MPSIAHSAAERLERVQRRELAVQALRGADRGAAHLGRDPVVVVEGHDVDHVDARAVGHGVLQDVQPVRLEPARLDRQRVLDLQRPALGVGPVLDQLDGLVAAVDAGRVVERVDLDVHVEPAHVVGRDHLLVRRASWATPLQVGDLGAARGRRCSRRTTARRRRPSRAARRCRRRTRPSPSPSTGRRSRSAGTGPATGPR